MTSTERSHRCGLVTETSARCGPHRNHRRVDRRAPCDIGCGTPWHASSNAPPNRSSEYLKTWPWAKELQTVFGHVLAIPSSPNQPDHSQATRKKPTKHRVVEPRRSPPTRGDSADPPPPEPTPNDQSAQLTYRSRITVKFEADGAHQQDQPRPRHRPRHRQPH